MTPVVSRCRAAGSNGPADLGIAELPAAIEELLVLLTCRSGTAPFDLG